MLYKAIYKIGVAVRNPSMIKIFSFLKESDKWSEKRLMDYQFERLKFMVDFAYGNTTYYKEKIRQC